MTAPVDIGTLIVSTPGIAGGKPRIAGTGITVNTISEFWNSGLNAEDIIATKFPQLSLAQVHAALTYYFANREAIEADLAAELEAYERARAEEHARRAAAERRTA